MFPIRDLNPSHRTPWVAWGLILVCAIVFVFQAIQPADVQRDLVQTYALTPRNVTAMFAHGFDPLVALTLFTSMFMHGGLLHVAGNLWFLSTFGDNVEAALGHVRFALFYLVCGVVAAVTQWAVDPSSPVPMIGASGAIAGVLGAYLVLHPRARVVFWQFVELPAFVVIGLWFVLQAVAGFSSLGMAHTGGGVAFFAHLGGFVAGLALALALRKRTAAPSALPPAYWGRGGVGDRSGGNYG